jgi:hypothetical protein
MFNLFARAECSCNDSLGSCQGKPNGVGQHLAKHQQKLFVHVRKEYGLWCFLWRQDSIIFNEKINQYSRTFAPQVQMPWNQAHAPLLVESFPKTPRTQSKTSQFGGFHN